MSDKNSDKGKTIRAWIIVITHIVIAAGATLTTIATVAPQAFGG